MATTVTRHSWMTSEPVHSLVQVLVDRLEINGTVYTGGEKVGFPVLDARQLAAAGLVKIL